MTKVGRNDNCPCGSGKKYKKCCLQTSLSEQPVGDLTYRKLRQLEGTIVTKHLMPYLHKTIPDDVMEFALEDFGWDLLPEEIDEEIMLVQLFTPWALFHWRPMDIEDVKDFDNQKTVAENYFTRFSNRLDKDEIQFIELNNEAYFSFYSVLEVDKGQGLRVKDCLLGTSHWVTEAQGTHHIERGHLIFGRLVTMNERTIFVGFSPCIIPAQYQPNIIQFRKWLIETTDAKNLSRKLLRGECEPDLFEYYFEILDELFEPKLPQLRNTDDEDLQFTKVFFKLELTPEEALKRISSLTMDDNIDSFLESAERDASGEITQLECPWLIQGNSVNKDWDNTVLGHIIIGPKKLTLETNSQERADKGRALLEELLGPEINYQQSLIESTEQILKNSQKEVASSSLSTSEELLKLPEVQEQLKDMAKSHWENWFDIPIPALEGQTPREASKTKEGQELLEALFLHYEAEDLKHGNNNFFKVDVSYLKGQLGLI